MRARTALARALVVLLTFTAVATGWAQTPEGLLSQDAASSGTTDVAKDGFEAPTEPPPEPEDSEEASVAGGGLFTAGNTRSMSITGAGQFKLRRSANQLSVDAAGNFGRASSGPDEPMEDTVTNVQGRVRYDRFITERVALFIGVSGRHDPFQGLDLRLNIDPGVAYYFIDVEKHQLWAEAGYDYQHDIRTEQNIREAIATGDPPPDKVEGRHNVRLFGGYENKLNEAVALTTGLEWIKSFTDSENWRLNYSVGLNSTIAGRLAAATTFTLRYDNNPLPNVKKTDAITAVSLVYTLL